MHITGNVSKIERALRLAQTCPNAYLLGAVRSISEASDAYGSALGSHVNLPTHETDREAAARLIHEAAHCYYGHATSTPETERVAMTEENIARKHLGCGFMRNPNDFSSWAQRGYGQQSYGVTHTSQDGSDPWAWVRELQRQADARS